jgi:hypothetical protein
LLTVDHFVVAFIRCGRNENGADEVFAVRTCIQLLNNVVKQLLDFFVLPDVFPLVVRDNVKAFLECFLNGVLVILDSGQTRLFIRSKQQLYLTTA